MYAAHRIESPARPRVHTTTFAKDEENLDYAADRNRDLRGRILTYCVAGTFGMLSPTYLHNGAATANWPINRIEIQEALPAIADAPIQSASDIAHIRQVMSVSVSELARVFGVSRQTVHEWVKGAAPSLKNAQRLSELAKAADVFAEADVEVTPQVLRRKVSGGQSLLESIHEEGKVVEVARKLVDTLTRESQQRQRLAARLAVRRKPALTPDDFGTPHLRDDA